MLIVLFLVAVVLFTTFLQVIDHLKFKKVIKDFEETKKKKVHESKMSKSFVILTVFVAMICIVLAIYIWLNPTSVPEDDYYLYIAFSFMLAFLFLTNLILGKQRQCLYYTEEGFFSNKKFVRFRSIRDIQVKPGLAKAAEVLLYSGEKIEINKDHLGIIKDLRINSTKKKDE